MAAGRPMCAGPRPMIRRMSAMKRNAITCSSGTIRRGLHFERWRCDRGCGKWFHAARDTVTMEFKAFYGITELPPREVMEQATGEWATYFKDRLKAEAKS